MELNRLSTLVYAITNLIVFYLSLLLVIRVFPEPRFHSRHMTALIIIILIGLTILEIWDAGHAYIQTLQMIGYSLINALFIKIFYTCKYLDSLLILLCFNINYGILKVPVLTLRGIYEKIDLAACNVINARIPMENIWCIIIISIALVLYYKYKKQILFIIKNLFIKNKIILFIALLLEYLLLIKMMQLGLYNKFEVLDLYLNTSIILVFALTAFICVLYFLYHKNKDEQQNILLRQSLLEEEHNTIKKYYEQDAQRLHDMKHLFIYLQTCISNQNLDEAQTCLTTYLGKIEQAEHRVWTGNTDVDFMINYHYNQMKEKEIQFQLETDFYELPIPHSEFMVILGNILDNAIEAAEKCLPEHRSIDLKLKNVNNMFILKSSNTYIDEPKTNGKKLLTSKADKSIHGWGLQNIKQIVTEYNGEVRISHEKGLFQITILF